MKQNQWLHGCRLTTAGATAKFLSMSLLLALMLLPSHLVAQTNYDKSVTFTALMGSENSFGGEGYEKLFDGKKTEEDFSKWCCTFSNPTYVIFEASKPGTPVGYTITTGNDNERETGRNPKSWNLYGNNEGRDGEWTLIQAVTDDNTLQNLNYTPYDFTCDGTEKYKYFKWEITANQGSSVLQVAEFELKLVTCTHKNEDGSSALGEALSSTPATCIRHAYTTHKCSICNEEVEVEEEGELAPHQYVVYKEAATCKRRAYTWKQCSVCNETVEGEEEGELAPHTLDRHEAKAATCYLGGNIEYWECSVCHKLFGDEKATDEFASESDTSVPSKGHAFNSEGTCTVCGYSDTLYPMIAMDGITIKSFEKWLSWEALNPSADELKDLGIPEGSKGLMSSKDVSYYYEYGCGKASFDISLKSDKPFVLSFDYALTPSSGIIMVSVDNECRVYDNITKSKAKIILGAGEHFINVEYIKSIDGASRAAIYNLKAEFSQTGATAIYDECTKTMTFRNVVDEPLSDNMFAVNEGQEPRYSFLEKRIEHIVIDESFKSYWPTSLANFFRHLDALTEIDGLENINTDQVNDMNFMFALCSSLKELDLSGFNFANVRNMYEMFAYCDNLERLIVPDVDKDKLNNYGSFLYECPTTVYCSPKEAAKGSNSIFAGNTMTPYVSINPDAEYGTLCVPVGSTLAEGGFTGFDKLYTVKVYDAAEGKIMLQEAVSIEPGVPYVYRRNLTDADPVADAITFTADMDAATVVNAPANDGSMLKGTFERITAPGGSYVLQTDGMFHPVAQGNATIGVGAYRAYLDLGSEQNAKVCSMVFDDNETTGIKGIGAAAAPADFYDLMGRKVSVPQKGHIYVTGGKKVLYE